MKKWIVLLVAFLAGISVVSNMFKVPPVMGILMDQLHVSFVMAGWLMSIFAVTGILLAFPAAMILGKLGPKKAGLIALAFTIIGSIAGSQANSASVLLLTRCIEGIGLGIINVIGPAVAAMWFEPRERGLPMGIWAAFFPVGSFIMFAVAHSIEGAYGWQGLWWFGAIFVAVSAVLYAIFVTAPGPGEGAGGGHHGKAPSLSEAFKNTTIWPLAIGMLLFGFAQNGYNTLAPTYFSKILQMDMGAANASVGLISLLGIISLVFMGWLLDRVPNKKAVMVTVYVLLTITWAFGFRLSPENITMYVIILGLISGCVPTMVFATAPETMSSPAFAGIAMATLTCFQQIGIFGSAPGLAKAMEIGGGWTAAGTVMVGAGIIAILVTVLFFKSKSLVKMADQPMAAKK